MRKSPAGGSLPVGGKHQFPANANPMADSKEFLGVYGFVTKSDFIMKMGTVNTAGSPHLADHGAGHDISPFAHCDLCQMRIGG